MILGGPVAAAFAFLVGYLLFRFKIREVWYALSSSALVEVLSVAFLMWEKVGGPVGRYLPYHKIHPSMESLYLVIYALVLLLIALFRPQRLASNVQDMLARRRRAAAREKP
jgi:ABC-type branched-subunit amino acid transport system permease subunit